MGAAGEGTPWARAKQVVHAASDSRDPHSARVSKRFIAGETKPDRAGTGDTAGGDGGELGLPCTDEPADMAVVRTSDGWEPWALGLTAKQRNRLIGHLSE